MNYSNREPKPLRFLSPLHRANRQAAIHLEERLRDLDVAAPDAHLVSYVTVYGPCAVGELVRVFGYKKPAMTGMLDRLEDRDLLRRDVNPSDRRSFVVSATGRGRKLAREARARVEKFDRAIIARVSKEDLRGFENVLRAVADATGVDVRHGSHPQPDRRKRYG